MFFARLRNNMRWVIILVAATFVIGGLYVGAGVRTQQTEAAPPLAEVNGRPISAAEFQRAYSNNVQLYSQFLGPLQGQMLEEIMYASLQDLITDVLVRAAAADASLPVSAQEIDVELAEIKAGFPDDATYKMALVRASLTEKQLRDLLREELAIRKLEQSVRSRAQVLDEETESLDELSVQALRQAAEDEEVRNWLEQLRADAVIAIHDPQLQARDHAVQGRYEESLELYQRAMVTDPFNPYLHVSAAAVYEQLGRTDEALAAYESALALNDGDPILHLLLGFAYREAERDEEAADRLRVAGELNPWDAQLQLLLMQTFTEMSLFDDALEAAGRLDELERLQAELLGDQQVEFDLLDEANAGTGAAAVDTEEDGADGADTP